MADTFDDGELFGIIRGRYNALATAHNALRADVDDILSGTLGGGAGGGIGWVSGNTLSRVTQTLGGTIWTFTLRANGNPSIDPASAQGATHWTLAPNQLIRLTASLGPYLAQGSVVYYDGRFHELLLSGYSSLPSGATDAQWRVVAGATVATPGGGGATPSPTITPTLFGPTTFGGTTTLIGSGQSVTVTFPGSTLTSLTALTDAEGRWSVTGTQTYTGRQFSLSVTQAAEDGGETAASGPYNVQGSSATVTPVSSIQVSVSSANQNDRLQVYWGTGNTGLPASYVTELSVNGTPYGDPIPAQTAYRAVLGLLPSTTYTISLVNIDTANGNARSVAVTGTATTPA